MHAIHTWFATWWLKVPEPRVINMIVGVIYCGFMLGGIATLTYPPRSITGAGGETAMLLVGLFLVIGSIIGMIAGSLDFWQLERLAIVTMGLGFGAYAWIVGWLQFNETGSRLTQLSVIIFGALGVLALRMAMIWRYDYKPRR